MRKFYWVLWVGILFYPATSCAPIPSVAAAWEKPMQPPAGGSWSAITADPLSPERALVAAGGEIFEQGPEGLWRLVWRSPETANSIRAMLDFPDILETLIILTANGAYLGDVDSGEWGLIFRGKSPKEKSVLSFAVFPGEEKHWFAGTEAGFFESNDAGKSWHPLTAFPHAPVWSMLFKGNTLFAAAGEALYRSESNGSFRKIFSLNGISEEEELIDEDSPENPELAANSLRPFTLIAEKGGRGRLWLGTRKGVFESSDDGITWSRLPLSGFKSVFIRDLLWAPDPGRLYAATQKGIYVYDFQNKIWQEIYQGLEEGEVISLALARGSSSSLFALTEAGLFQIALPGPFEVASEALRLETQKASLFQRLTLFEPSARELQQAVVRHNDLSPGKIKRWQWASRIRALVPDFSFGRDFSKSNSVDIDRRGTNEPDFYISGPDDLSRGWDMDVSWDLGNLIWDSAQTSIDSRSKIDAEYRNDLLAEATRVYYERRRLQMEILFGPATIEWEHLQKLIRMQELTSLLDGMSGGFMAKRLEKMYAEHPELNALWDFPGQA